MDSETSDIPSRTVYRPRDDSPGWGQGSDDAAPASTGRSHSHGHRTDVHAGGGGRAASSRWTQRDGTRGREGLSGFWQRRGVTSEIPPQPPRGCEQPGSGSVCVGFPLGVPLVGLPELVHSALIHGIKPATRPRVRHASWFGQAHARVLGARQPRPGRSVLHGRGVCGLASCPPDVLVMVRPELCSRGR